MPYQLRQLECLPDGFLTVEAPDLWRLMPSPTLVRLPGRHPEPLFVSILLHGNETTGLIAIQRLLARYPEGLPRPLLLFVGNVHAARYGVRHLEEQCDFNRVWPGGDHQQGPEARLMAEVYELARRESLFASVDLHNNTGINPHYACVNVLDHRFLQLATLFNRTVVYFIRPPGVQSMAFAQLAPAVTLECGKVGFEHGINHAVEFLDACMHLSEIPAHAVAEHDCDLFHTVAQVKIPPAVSFGFQDQDQEICLVHNLDHLNFRPVPRGTLFGQRKSGSDIRFEVLDEQGRDVGERFFDYRGEQILSKVETMPSMLTLDEEVIRQDCLCYLMERIPLPDSQA